MSINGHLWFIQPGTAYSAKLKWYWTSESFNAGQAKQLIHLVKWHDNRPGRTGNQMSKVSTANLLPLWLLDLLWTSPDSRSRQIASADPLSPYGLESQPGEFSQEYWVAASPLQGSPAQGSIRFRFTLPAGMRSPLRHLGSLLWPYRAPL